MPLAQDSFNFYSLLVLLGGLSIFLYGLEMMSHNLKKAAGDSLRFVLEKVTEHRVYGLAVGTVITGIIQSSSATTAILVSLVQSGLMGFERTVAIIMGANIGTTVTGQIFAFKITAWALPIIFLGFIFYAISKRMRYKNVGASILGLGLIFMGLASMSTAMKPLRASEFFLDTVQSLENIWLGVLVGAIFTALIQSSSATIGIMIGMSLQGLISIEAAVPVIFGANLGTCATAILASLQASYEAKRVAAAHILFNVGGVLLFIFWIPDFLNLVQKFSPTDDIPRQIANAQTFFNVAASLIWLPFVKQLQWLSAKLIPEDKKSNNKFKLPHVRNFLQAPELALAQAKAAIKHMKNLVKAMMISSRSFLVKHSPLHEEAIAKFREEQKELRVEVLEFLSNLNRQRLSSSQTADILNQMSATNEIELVANRLEMALERLSQKGNPRFEREVEELEEYFRKTVKYFSKSCNAFVNGSLADSQRIAEKILSHKGFEKRFKRKYIEKIHEGGVSESPELDQLNLEVLEVLRSINSASLRICGILIEDEEKVPA